MIEEIHKKLMTRIPLFYSILSVALECDRINAPASSSKVIVVISMCFITGVSNLLITNDLIFKRFLGHTFGHTFSASTLKSLKTYGKL